MTVGDKIRKYRLEQGYTQKELAIKAGLSESAVRNYELIEFIKRERRKKIWRANYLSQRKKLPGN